MLDIISQMQISPYWKEQVSPVLGSVYAESRVPGANMSGLTRPSVVGPLLEKVARFAHASEDVFGSANDTFS